MGAQSINNRLVITPSNYPSGGVIESDVPVALVGLKGHRIRSIKVTSAKHSQQPFLLHINGCENLKIDEVTLEGVVDDSSKDAWKLTASNGVLCDSPSTCFGSLFIFNTHMPLQLRARDCVVKELLVNAFSGDAFQICADGCQILDGDIYEQLEVYEYDEYHLDVGMLFPLGGGVLRDILVQGISFCGQVSDHPWSAKEPQGLLATDGEFERCVIRDCHFVGVHKEHGVSFGLARDCVVERVVTDGLIRFGDRKSQKTGVNNRVIDCTATVLFEDGSGLEEKRDMTMTTTKRMSDAAARILMQSEGFENSIYLDQAGLPTIGVGHLLTQSEVASGKIHLTSGEVIDMRDGSITDDQVHQLLGDDLPRYEAAVERCIGVRLTQDQFDALVHFTFNVGETALDKSTLKQKLNRGDYEAVPEQIRRWTKVTIDGKKVDSQGLINRRETEVKLWCGDHHKGRSVDTFKQLPRYESQHQVPHYYLKDDAGYTPVFDDPAPPQGTTTYEVRDPEYAAYLAEKERKANSKSFVKSKVNWGALVVAGASVAGLFGIDVSQNTIQAATHGASILGSIFIFVSRTWFTKKFIG